jgi:hypothetical protein
VEPMVRRATVLPRRRGATEVLLGAVLGAALTLGGATLAGWPAGLSEPACRVRDPHPEWSTAREWNELALAAIRRDVPAPTIHARTLLHTTMAVWDAWAAYDPAVPGLVVDVAASASDVDAARDVAMSVAAHRVLSARYRDRDGASDTLPALDALLAARCVPPDHPATGDSPAALGARIGEAVLAAALDDGANEAGGYAPPDRFAPVNPPLVVADGAGADPGAGPGAEGMADEVDVDRWQPLQLDRMITQNGIPVDGTVQESITPHWGFVRAVALGDPGPDGLPVDPGPPPRLADGGAARAELLAAVVEVLELSARLDPAASRTIDASPASLGANPLGVDTGSGHPVNPATGAPYAPNPVLEADLERAIAEYWADGPESETPPGHWMVLANEVSDRLDPDLRIGGEGPPVERLEWDVKLHLVLAAANHDAAVAAWGLKGFHDTARPISLVRRLGALGQSSDPAGPSFDPQGLPLVEGLIEVVTDATTAPGGRHAHLTGSEGSIAVRAWRGTPADATREVAGVGWVLAVDWLPYQRDTFVSPAFAGYVSGHSAFSHASAVVLAEFTGDAHFPGGLHTHAVPAGWLRHEAGPSAPIELQWATYADAADQAGRSRRVGGIHVAPDDLAGRRVGAACGRAVWAELEPLVRAGAGGG